LSHSCRGFILGIKKVGIARSNFRSGLILALFGSMRIRLATVFSNIEGSTGVTTPIEKIEEFSGNE
jgi:hypothetical protein